MFSAVIFLALATTTAVASAWAIPANTALLVVLAVLSFYNEHKARQEREEVARHVKVVSDKLQRKPTERTRKTDKKSDNG